MTSSPDTVLAFPQISDNAGNVYAHFSMASQPALIVIDTNGTTRTVLGAVDETALDAALHSGHRNLNASVAPHPTSSS